MGLVPKTMSIFCIGYIKKEDFWCVSEIGTELALYKDRCQVRYQWLYLADMNQEDDENAEKRRSFPQQGQTPAGGEKEAVSCMASGSQSHYCRDHGKGRI